MSGRVSGAGLAILVACNCFWCGNDETHDSCKVNADCADSDTAAEWAQIKCRSEVYCLSGRCKGHCLEPCEDVRTDMNPCTDGGLCAPEYNGAEDYSCTMLPIACDTREDCPRYRPTSDAGTSDEWACVDGVCSYPGLEYATK